ncbi:CBS domain-containing protein [Rhodococcus rhodochrous]|uniref:CBS domain-containing protein n=1 Tax=Rhodococcus rhodochrous TaxID=1829 RepID=UPI000D04CFD8|nr:CBS domain-containing protein [Rhodococcus rhodochrous]AYA23167.1 CBS domain-containing protein [Rhodococcus rhodochrous]
METLTSHDPAREFLDLWSDIEQHLKQKYSLAENARGMGDILAATHGRDALVRRYAPDLTAFRELRNAISHHRYRDGTPIATPRRDTIERLRRIHHELLNPVRIGQCLRGRAVITATPEQPLRDALREMMQYTFSQLPVYDNNNYLELLTTNAVARWLAAQISDAGEVLVDQVRVREVLDFVEPTEKVLHRAKTVTVAAVIDDFRENDSGALVAVIVSEQGLRTQKPLGVVVRDDISFLLEQLPAVGV